MNNSMDFLIMLKNLLEKTADAGGNVYNWQNVLSSIRLKSIYDEEISKNNTLEIENIINKSRVLISEISLQNKDYQHIQKNILVSQVNSISQNLMINYDINNLIEAAYNDFPKLNISSCYINIYENPDKPEEYSRLIMAYNENERIKIDNGGIIFPTKKIIPDKIKSNNDVLYIMNLYFQKEQIGFFFDIYYKITCHLV